jgi:hypothetical protein
MTMTQEIAAASSDAYDLALGGVISAINAAEKTDFRSAFDLLSHAQHLISSQRLNVGVSGAAPSAKYETMLQTIEFFTIVFQATAFRIERNPGKAREAWHCGASDTGCVHSNCKAVWRLRVAHLHRCTSGNSKRKRTGLAFSTLELDPVWLAR